MGTPQTTIQHTAIRWQNGEDRAEPLELINEEPLLICVQGVPYTLTMRTPGDEIELAAGYCLGEGLLTSRDDVLSIETGPGADPNVRDVRLTPRRLEKVRDQLDKRGIAGQAARGVSGAALLQELEQSVPPVKNGFSVPDGRIPGCLETLFISQDHYRNTKGTHAALLLDEHLQVLAFAEDVGRHNALDKVLGKAFLDGALTRTGPLVLSSRMSLELVQKAARAGLEMIISKSRPTALAAAAAQILNMTLVSVAGSSGLLVLDQAGRVGRVVPSG